MGTRGPAPKRSDQRRRRNSPKAEKVAVPFRQSREDQVKELVATHTRDQLLDATEAAGLEVPPKARKAELAELLIDVGTDPDWHPVAKEWFRALEDSGQAHFYEPSDWALARLIAEAMSRDLKPQIVGVTDEGEPIAYRRPLNAASVKAYLSAASDLMSTESSRRRLQVELDRPEAEAPPAGADAVTLLSEYRDRTG